LVLEAFLRGGIRWVLCCMVVVSTCLTALYRGIIVYGVLFGRIRPRYIGGMVSRSYVYFPCRVLGLGALFGRYFLQSRVLMFNTVFNLNENLKLIPIICVISGCRVLIIILIWKNYNVFSIENKDKGFEELIHNFLAKMWFLPALRSDIHRGVVLRRAGSVKDIIEDGHLEHTIGRESV